MRFGIFNPATGSVVPIPPGKYMECAIEAAASFKRLLDGVDWDDPEIVANCDGFQKVGWDDCCPHIRFFFTSTNFEFLGGFCDRHMPPTPPDPTHPNLALEVQFNVLLDSAKPKNN